MASQALDSLIRASEKSGYTLLLADRWLPLLPVLPLCLPQGEPFQEGECFSLEAQFIQNSVRYKQMYDTKVEKDHLVAKQTQVQFPAPTWWRTIIHNSSSRGSDALSLGTRDTHGTHTYIYASKILI